MLRSLPITCMVAISAVVGGASSSLAQVPSTLPPLIMRETADYQYVRAFFPADADPTEPDQIVQMADNDKRLASEQLRERAAALRENFTAERPAILAALTALDVQLPSNPSLPSSVKIEFQDGDEPVAAAIGGDTIVISGKTVRGFLVGSLREAIDGTSAESWFVASMLSWPVKDKSLTVVEWERRFKRILEILDEAGPLTATEDEQLREVTRRFERFQELNDSGEIAAQADEEQSPAQQPDASKLSASQLWVLAGAFNAFTMQLSQPAENYLLAHELGHLFLRHNDVKDPECSSLQKMERDADAFAIALLSYIPTVGGIEALFYLGASASQSPDAFLAGDPGDELAVHRNRFGYHHAFKYGMAEAGMNFGGGGCGGLDETARLDQTAALRRAVMVRRLAAVGELAAYGRRLPATVAHRKSREPLSEAAKLEMLSQAKGGCAGVPAQVVTYPPVAMLSNDYSYFVACERAPPTPSEFSLTTIHAAGQNFFNDWVRTYSVAVKASAQ